MIRCRTCLYPQGKPDLYFDDTGMCAACRNYLNRPEIDWEQRKRELVKILSDAKRNNSGYDCIVASSGGKDSHAIALSLIALGVRPLLVTATTDLLTPLGRANIDNLARFATTIEVTPNRSVRAKLNRLGLELVGDICWPEHASIFTVPFRVAVNMGIPLIFYGENPQHQYGGPLGAELAATMTRRWISEFGGFLGLRPSDFAGREGITEADMADYIPPRDGEMEKVKAYFLGQFLPWDSEQNAQAARQAGMRQSLPCLANWWDAENLDNAMTGLHDHAMYRKYGYGRAVAQLSVDIRKNRITREAAMKAARACDGLFPLVYGDVRLDDVLDHLGMTLEELFFALDAHTNWKLFSGVKHGRPILKEWSDAREEALQH